MIAMDQILAEAIIDERQRRLLEQDIEVWIEIYEVLLRMLEEVARSNKLNRHLPLYTLLKDFDSFCEAYFKYFEFLLNTKGAGASDPDYIRQQALERILDEWMTISQVVEQRQLPRYEEWLAGVQAAAEPFLPPAAPPVVTYLGRLNTLRHLPYSRVSVASIPRGAYNMRKEATMALAHEVGHHVWRLTLYDQFATENAAIKVGEFVPRLVIEYALEAERLDVMIMAWLEELFADVYGAFVGGADFATSFIDNYARRVNSLEDLFVDDGEHPFPYLRPLVRVQVLKYLNDPMAAEIGQRWLDFCTGKGVNLDAQEIDYFVPSPAQDESLMLDDLPLVQPPPDGHWHYWQKRTVRLATLVEVVERVVNEGLLPYVEWARTAEPLAYQDDRIFTFQWILNDYFRVLEQQQQRANIGQEALKLVMQPISTLMSELAEGTGGSGGGIIVGTKNTYTHTHGGSTHTHRATGVSS